MPYVEAWNLQKSLAKQRAQSAVSDSLVLLEHPHTYTLGSSGKLEHVLFDEAERSERGISVHHVDRGGDITYHGPGQLVGYPILQLPRHNDGLRADVVAYVRQLENMLIEAIANFGIKGQHLPKYTGVWVEHEGCLQKISAIGVKVTVHAITYHGFALNVNTDLDYFKGIIPCGIDDKPVTSMAEILGYSVDIQAVIETVIYSFEKTFKRRLVHGEIEFLSQLSV